MFLPLFFKSGLSCLIIGGGQVASHKIKILREALCDITVVAPQISGYVAEEMNRKSLRWLEREYIAGDCEGYQLVIAATPYRDVNRRISEEAWQRGIPINVVDDPELSTVIFPAIWREKSLSIAVSTGGVAPFLAAEIRSLIAGYARGMGRWVEAAGRFRDAVKKEIAQPGDRNALYGQFLDAGRPNDGDTPPEGTTLSDWMLWLDEIKKKGC